MGVAWLPHANGARGRPSNNNRRMTSSIEVVSMGTPA